AGDRQLEIELAELEIRVRHVADERAQDLAARPFLREHDGPGRLAGPSKLPPEVQLPRERQADPEGAAPAARDDARVGALQPRCGRIRFDGRELVRGRDPEPGPGL